MTCRSTPAAAMGASHGSRGPLALRQCVHCRLHQVPVTWIHTADRPRSGMVAITLRRARPPARQLELLALPSLLDGLGRPVTEELVQVPGGEHGRDEDVIGTLGVEVRGARHAV